MRGARLAVRGEAFPSRFTRSNKEAVIMSADKRPSSFFVKRELATSEIILFLSRR